MDGTLTIEKGTIYDALDLAARNMGQSISSAAAAARQLPAPARLHRTCNPVERARKNVAHHYDLSGALYDLFLTRTGSIPAYFAPTMTAWK
jgi:cyclopropane-fatty-acyl-phospholipid synthase